MNRYESFISFVRFLILSEFVIQTTGRCSADEPISCQCCIFIPPGNVIKPKVFIAEFEQVNVSSDWPSEGDTGF